MKRKLALSISFVLAACGGGRSDEVADLGDPTDEELDRIVEEAHPDGKADAPSRTVLLGDLSPGSTATAEVSPERRFVGWTFRAEGETAVNATARPTTPPAGSVVVLYRRTSCFGTWQPVARGAEALSSRLPGEGEYMLVTGARSPTAATRLDTTYSVDQRGKIADPARQPPKLARSWLISDTLDRLSGAGVTHFSQLREPRHKEMAKRAGFSDLAIKTIADLGPWLDVPWIDYERACVLKRAGTDKPEDYYRLSRAAQNALEPQIPLGSVPYSRPGESTGACVDLEPPRGDSEAWRNPGVVWRWQGNGNTTTHPIGTRPWWGVVDQAVLPGDPLYNEQRKWTPSAEEGWELLGYQFGVPSGTGGETGYLLFHHRYTGVLRLFVYIPTNQGYSQLLAHLSLADRRATPLETWSFPILDRPPHELMFQAEAAPVIGNGPDKAPDGLPFTAIARTSSFLWRHAGTAFEDLSGGGSTGSGKWVRAEISTLYDPGVYPSDPTVAANRRLMKVGFTGLQVGDADLFADLHADLNGKAVPMHQIIDGSGRSTVGIIAGTTAGTIATGAAGGALADFLDRYIYGLPAGGRGALGLMVASAAAGLFTGLLGGPDELHAPQYNLAVSGAVTGAIRGKIYTQLPLSELHVNLSGTFSPTQPNLPAGAPQAYQRCDRTRVTALGFVSADGRGSDPRPQFVPIAANGCTSSTARGDTTLAVGARAVSCRSTGAWTYEPVSMVVGSLRKAPWAPISIRNQVARLEAVFPSENGELPRRVLGPPGTQQQTAGPIRLTPFLMKESDLTEIRNGRGKIYIRWGAEIVPTDRPGAKYYAWTEAVDVSDRAGISGPSCQWVQEEDPPVGGTRGRSCQMQ